MNNFTSFIKKSIVFIFLFIVFFTETQAQDCSVNAGVGRAYCPNSEIVLDGNGSGLYYDTSIRWTIVSQPGGSSISIINPRQYATKTTVATVAGNYVFRLSLKCSDGVISSQDVTYTIGTGAPSVPAINDGGVASPLCVSSAGGTTITFTGHTAPGAGFTEEWSYSSGVFGGSFSSTSTSNPTFTFNSLDPYKCPTTGIITITRTFRSTASGCVSTISKSYTVIANNPVDYKFSTCSGINFTGTCPGNGTGSWSLVSASPASPAPIFSTTTGSNSSITNPASGTAYTVRYTVSGNACTNGTKDYTFTYSPSSSLSSTTANAGPDQIFATVLPASITLDGNAPNTTIGETGIWTQVSGATATIVSPTSANTNVTGLVPGGAYIFRWTIFKTDGCGSSDEMTVKGPITLNFTEGTLSCNSSFGINNPSAVTLGSTSNFIYGVVDSVNFKITLISKPAGLGDSKVPIRLELDGGSSCSGSGGCQVVIDSIGNTRPTINVVGKPGLLLTSADLNASDLRFRLTFYPKASGDYVFAYEYSTNAGIVKSGTARILTGRILTANAGTDIVLGCGVTTSALSGNTLSFDNTTDPSNFLTYAPIYNGEWETVTMPAGATDPINATNKYQKNPSLSGLIQGKYTFRLSISGNSSTGCGSDDFMDLYVTNTAPTSVAMPASMSACKGADISLSVPETGFYPKGWAVMSGPSTPTFLPTAQSRNVSVSGLVSGTYTFSFTDSSRCGNATGTTTVTVSGADSITQAKFDSCRFSSDRKYYVAARRPNYGNGETATFFKLVKGVPLAISASPDGKTVTANGTFTSGGLTDTGIIITSFPSTSVSDVIVLVYQISKSGCGTTSDTIVLKAFTTSVNDFRHQRNVELCNQTLPLTVTPYTTSDIPTAGNGPSNSEWLGKLYAKWSVLSIPPSAASPTFGAQGDINSTVTFNASGEYVLKVTFPELNPGTTFCTEDGINTEANNFIYLYYKIGAIPAVATNAGPDRTYCALGVVSLSATPARGFWSIQSFNNSPSPMFVNDTLNTTTITFPSSGDAQLKWTPRPEYAWCAASGFDVVNISYLDLPKIAGGSIQNLCSVPTSLNLGLNAKGSNRISAAFTQISGPTTTIINLTSGETVAVSNFSTGTYKFKYTFTSDSCGTNNDTLTLNIGTCLSVSGHIWNDVDGDAINDATEKKTNVANTMWAYLTNEDGVIIDKVQVDSTGYYSFNEVLSGFSYKVVIGKASNAEAGNTMTTATLPNNWVNTGTNEGGTIGTANPSNKTGVINLGTVSTSLTNRDFGIEQAPFADSVTLGTRGNPLGTGNVTLISGFSGTDSVTHYISSITITKFPDDITSLRIGNITYYPSADSIPTICPTTSCLVFPSTGGLSVATDTNGKPIDTIRFDPHNGDRTIRIPYVTIDQAGVASLVPGVVRIPLIGVVLPINILAYSVSSNDCINYVNWRTSGDEKMKSYDLLRSTDGKSFITIVQLATKKGTINEYEYADKFDQPALYKLRINFLQNNEYAYTETKKTNGCDKSKIKSIIVYPNPTENIVHFDNLDNVAQVSVYNSIGQLVKTLSETEIAKKMFETKNFAAGMYIIVLQKSIGENINIQLNKIK